MDRVVLSLAILIILVLAMLLVRCYMLLSKAREDVVKYEATSLSCNINLKYFQRRSYKQSETILVMLKRNALLSKTVKKQKEEIKSLQKLI